VGFSTVLSAAILYIPLAVSIVIYASIYSQMVDAISEVRALEGGGASLRIVDAWLDSSTNQTIYFYLENTGSHPLWRFGESDVIIRISDSTGNATYLLAYERDWRVVSILSSGLEIAYSPGDAVYPGEQALIEVDLPSKVEPPYEASIVFVYAAGGKATFRVRG